MRQKLVAGNWKMNGSQALVKALVPALAEGADKKAQKADQASCQLLVCPPFPYLQAVAESLGANSPVALGAQDCAATEQGAFTGEVAASMLADLGVTHVLVGHSERRHHQQETDALVLAKTQQALAAGLTPLICLGESLEEREAGQTTTCVLRQLQAVAAAIPAEQLAQLIFAYEPVWAIGTGLTATPEQAQDVHASLRQALREFNLAAADEIPLLYGGSMKAENAASLLAMPDIDGGLIGGASLDADQFLAIARAAS